MVTILPHDLKNEITRPSMETLPVSPEIAHIILASLEDPNLRTAGSRYWGFTIWAGKQFTSPIYAELVITPLDTCVVYVPTSDFLTGRALDWLTQAVSEASQLQIIYLQA